MSRSHFLRLYWQYSLTSRTSTSLQLFILSSFCRTREKESQTSSSPLQIDLYNKNHPQHRMAGNQRKSEQTVNATTCLSSYQHVEVPYKPRRGNREINGYHFNVKSTCNKRVVSTKATGDGTGASFKLRIIPTFQ